MNVRNFYLYIPALHTAGLLPLSVEEGVGIRDSISIYPQVSFFQHKLQDSSPSIGGVVDAVSFCTCCSQTVCHFQFSEPVPPGLIEHGHGLVR